MSQVEREENRWKKCGRHKETRRRMREKEKEEVGRAFNINDLMK